MRKLISSLFITLDGVVEAPHRWNPPYYEADMTALMQTSLAASDTHLYGRHSYELFRSVFTGPAAGRIAHAQLMTEKPKVLVSSTVERGDWGPTTVIGADVAAAIRRLKAQSGGNIGVQASATLVRLLLREGLLDELRLLVHPVVLGEGALLFDRPITAQRLRLIESTPLSSGVVHVRLAPDPDEGPTAADAPAGARAASV